MILFLDIDGVLHPSSGSSPFVPTCVAVLETLLSDCPDIEIVITSSWREQKSLPELKALLGAQIGPRVIGITPVIDEPFLHHVRFHETQMYLTNTDVPDTPWVAVDDEIGNYPPDSPVVIADRRTGLTDSDGLRLKALILAQQQDLPT